MHITDVLETLHAADTFTAWKKEHTHHFLAHIFKMLDKENHESWQVGYYNPESGSILSFLVEGDNVSALEESEPFKKPGTSIKELNMEDVQIDHGEAISIANKTQKESYPQDQPVKTFFILQHIEGKTVYNITYFTATFKTLNIRVSAQDGRIVKEELNQFFSFK